jgi:hypothetical protein
MQAMLLTEEVSFLYEALQQESGPFKLRGLVQKANAKNQNGRVYTTDILNRELTRLSEPIKNRRLVGQLDHPQTATIEYAKASHLVTALTMEESGDMIGELELLDTPAGRIAKSLVESKVQIGISSRGLGTVRKEENLLVVNDDFQLVTFDIVAEPSTPNAYPTRISEDLIRKITGHSKPRNIKKEMNKLIDSLIWKR